MKAFSNTLRNEEFNGMDLRDYFAAKAMQAIITNPKIEKIHPDADSIAQDAYVVADAMIQRR